MTELEILTAVRELLTPPAAWIQGVFAQDEGGACVHWSSPWATCWCLSGVLNRVSAGADPDVAQAARRRIEALVDKVPPHRIGASVMPWSMVTWQDRPERTHGEVLALLDEAIGLAREVAA